MLVTGLQSFSQGVRNVTIRVAGPRGEGNTVTAMRIMAMLRSLGLSARYEGHMKAGDIEAILKDDPSLPWAGVEPREFLVVDNSDHLQKSNPAT
ncbi:MAG TPA: hypothetical protein VFE62_21030 [Gemmataceae bacterium]|nr:hypothetical protein [Gemmataceae bacterium]